MEITKLSTKGQVVIPKKIRAGANLKEGDSLMMDVIEDFVVMKKMTKEIPKEKLGEVRDKFIEMERMLYPD